VEFIYDKDENSSKPVVPLKKMGGDGTVATESPLTAYLKWAYEYTKRQ
jgi:hypothetical protein